MYFMNHKDLINQKEKCLLDFSHMLFAYHNTDSDSINSKNYEVEPHFSFINSSEAKKQI